MDEDQFGGIDPPAERLTARKIDVHGREEHETMLADVGKMLSLGLDPYFESMVYLKRWGSYLKK